MPICDIPTSLILLMNFGYEFFGSLFRGHCRTALQGIRSVDTQQLSHGRFGGGADNHAFPIQLSPISKPAAERFACSRRACQCTPWQCAVRQHAVATEQCTLQEYILCARCSTARATLWCENTETMTKIIILTCSCSVSFIICRESEGSEQVTFCWCQSTCSGSEGLFQSLPILIITHHWALLLPSAHCISHLVPRSYSPLNGPDMSCLV